MDVLGLWTLAPDLKKVRFPFYFVRDLKFLKAVCHSNSQLYFELIQIFNFNWNVI
jgi:hypothetical protein